MKRKLLIIFTLIILFECVFIANKSIAMQDLAGYRINNYDVEMIVNEDNSINVTEKIDVYFTESRHGIYRSIPLRNTVNRADGTTSKNKVRINEISVSENYSTIRTSDKIEIKIGSADELVSGNHTYEISYTYRLGKDPLKDIDELYYNIIGTEWGTDIRHVDFRIEMPESFDENKLGFTSGAQGSTDNYNVDWDVRGNIITGECDGLGPNEGLTVRLELPDGYFKYSFLKENRYFLFVSVLCFFFIIYADYLWRKYGKDDKPIETVEFYPPNNINSAEAQYYHDGKSTSEGVISLLVYLANKGYLKIEVGKRNILEEEKFTLIKLKDYDGDVEEEKMFFEGLFKKKSKSKIDLKEAQKLLEEAENEGKEITLKEALDNLKASETKETVSSTSLKYSFYRTVDKIQKQYSKRKDEIFVKNPKSPIVQLVIMVILTLIFAMAVPLCSVAGPSVIFVMLFPLIALVVLISGFSSNSPSSVKSFLIIWALMFGGIPLFGMVTIIIGFGGGLGEFSSVILGIITLVGLLIFLKEMPKRNAYGNEMLGRIKGFKNFLETAEKERLEALVFENPNYFFDILPYTYSLRS